eukprot:Sspe_Gene.65520::Locus_38779_Transcript_1_2_Confidence_0.667_Length_1498::g.65520::m.65520
MLAGYLPFDDQNMNALFNKIERGEYRMARHFTEPVKDLISRMLQVDPEKRIDMKGIIAHRWFQEGGFDQSKVDAFRGTTAVKPSEKQVSAWASDATETGAKDKRQATVPKGLNAFQIISALTQGTLHSLTVQQGSVAIKRSTRFIMNLSPDECMKKIESVLQEMKGNPRPCKQNPYELKGFINTSKSGVATTGNQQTDNRGMLTYAIGTQPTVSPSLTLVEMRRTRGDTLDFHELYREILRRLEANVVSREHPPGQEPSS